VLAMDIANPKTMPEAAGQPHSWLEESKQGGDRHAPRAPGSATLRTFHNKHREVQAHLSIRKITPVRQAG
jgi:hypothetical protein